MAFPRKLLSVTTTDFAFLALADGGSISALPVDANAITESSGPVLVFRPNDPLGNHANVFVDFPSLMAARALLNGPWWLDLQGDLANCVAPASGGAPWNFDECNVTSRGAIGTNANVLFFAQGAQITYNTLRLFSGAKFRNQSTAPVAVQTVSGSCLYLEGISALLCVSADAGAAPFLQASSFTRIVMSDESGIGASLPTITVDAGQTLFISGSDQANVVAGSIVGLGILLTNLSADARLGAQTITTVNTALQDLASQVSFTPTTPSNWTTPVPTTDQQGLDQLAARALRNTTNTQLAFTLPFAAGAGKPLLVIDITPQTSGLLMLMCTITIVAAALDQPEFQVQYVDLLTAITGGTAGPPGITTEPTSVTGAAPVIVAQHETNLGALEGGSTAGCVGLLVPVIAVAGHRTGIVIVAASLSAINWTNIFCNLMVREF